MFGDWFLAPTILLILLYILPCANPNFCYAYKLPRGKVTTWVFNPCVELRQRKSSPLGPIYGSRDNFEATKRIVSISDGDIPRTLDLLGFPSRGSKAKGWNAARSFIERVGLTQKKWQNGNTNRRNVRKKKNTYLFLFTRDHIEYPPIRQKAKGRDSAIYGRSPKKIEHSSKEGTSPRGDEEGRNSKSVRNEELITSQEEKYKKRKYAKVKDEKKKKKENLQKGDGEGFTEVVTSLQKKEVKQGKDLSKLGSKLIYGENNDPREAITDDSIRRSTSPMRNKQKIKNKFVHTNDGGNTHSIYGQGVPSSYYKKKRIEKEASYKDSQQENAGIDAYKYPLVKESYSKLRTPEGDTPSEDNIGKTFEGEVYSVSPNAIIVKIKNTNLFGMLFKKRCNFGDDVEDLNEYFKVKQKIFVKVLGINMKKKLYYLGNIIKYNPDVELKIGDTSKGLITKLCESYVFVKVLKNGSTGYLHRSKVFSPSEAHVGEENKGRHNHRWNDLLRRIQFTEIFKIWDIIDVEIYEKPDVNFKSNYILTIPEESKTFSKVLTYFDSLSEKLPHEEEVNQVGGENIVDQAEGNLFLNEGGSIPLDDPSGEGATDNRKRRSRTSYTKEGHHTNPTHEQEKNMTTRGTPFLKKSKETIHKDRASTKLYRVPENASLSVFAKITKISLSSLKKFFIINESREYHSGHALSSDQIKKASDHFKISCVVDVGEEFQLEGDPGEGSTVEAATPDVCPTRESNLADDVVATTLESSPGKGRNKEEEKEKEIQGGVKANSKGEIKFGKKSDRVVSKPARISSPMEDPIEKNKKRNIVVTFIGHINHGKTSLFDYICKTNERDKEKGLITQNIRAFKVKSRNNDFTFTLIDTPGHEAFMPIRSRGVKISDVSILVISGEEGIQEQTVECIKLIKEHDIRIVIAVTKMDLPNVSVDRIVNDLVYHEIYTEMNGGDVQVVPCSIMNADSMDKLVDAVYLESEFLELPLEENKDGQGVILDSYVDRNGIVSINLVQSGTLRVNDYFYTGSSYGKVKMMKDHLNKKVNFACASDPVMVVGYEKNSIPVAGDKFYVVKNETIAEEIAQHHRNELLASQMRDFSYGQEEGSLDRYQEYIIREGAIPSDEQQKQKDANDHSQLEETATQEDSPQGEDSPEDNPTEKINNEREIKNFQEKDLRTVYVSYFIKCDKQGTIDVLKNCLQKLQVNDTLHRVRNKIVYSSIGDITASDITYAQSFDAIIIGFNVKLSKSFPKNGKNITSGGKSNSRIIYVNVLYDLIEEVENVMKEKLSSKPRGTYKGQASILKVFNVSKLGKVAGCVITSGTVNNNSNVRILRNDKVIHIGKIVSLKIGKEEKEQIKQGEECGMGFDNFVDFLPGDTVESYEE
ncbi:MB2 protein, putative [Plasmodium knowlesi strain H]|uniref:Translation initiation factor IF-2, chloroplastic n=3 Tax=Plasmodium knowlesi TaxID=5850 RepID=A0A5K1V736_PLAKH|nr:sporozoite surface antigen MB2, putative [Plasmodium knowlesi strain H]OTN67041.1 putative MB2 protein [Plasmodium knowlesi]CAA9988673.1 sporozoite surface antigen MB2, putative [Plasmodium knowlesi strain H]SBO21573.1 MB2 protein, putative [Plasmodium knowlesi strain H]SBO21952.1 MB2 protein, putative [Plasmodium knowlesi strain H]VVS78147.1 sporozoite surface antigen MB2, putative [Plasmodium knowlesi strain H]|eukprot:XP_002259650.1 MB2 protein, putative [Plasmodium knowlesi strain H]